MLISETTLNLGCPKLGSLIDFTIFTKNYLTMKKLYLILALIVFSGSYAVNTFAATNDSNIELKDDDKKKKKKRKKNKKKSCEAKSKSCASSSTNKSCCSKKDNN